MDPKSRHHIVCSSMGTERCIMSARAAAKNRMAMFQQDFPIQTSAGAHEMERTLRSDFCSFALAWADCNYRQMQGLVQTCDL